jgi:hypothetical protein
MQRAACIEFLYWRHVSFQLHGKTPKDEASTCRWKGAEIMSSCAASAVTGNWLQETVACGKWNCHTSESPLSCNKTSDTRLRTDRSVSQTYRRPALQCAWKHNRKHAITLQQLHQLALRYREARKVTPRSLNPCNRTRRRYITTGHDSNLRRPCQLTTYRRLSFDAVCIKLCSSKSVI